MSAPLADIVSALSAEETCSVCSESYAAVDQNLCSKCGARLCPDCSLLRPDAQWTCATCESRAPTRVFSLLSRPASTSGAREHSGSHTLNMVALKSSRLAGLQTVQARARLATSRLSALAALFALLIRPLALAWEHAAPKLRAHFARVQDSFRRDLQALTDALHGTVGAALASVRVRVAERVLSIRNLSLREHAMALLLCTAILVSVSRSHRTNPR